jgi:hypothetical protein
MRSIMSCAGNRHHGLPDLLSLSKLLRGRELRAELHQGRCLVGNLAGLLGDPVGLGAVVGYGRDRRQPKR